MKILRLDLLAYGPFTNESLDLSAGSEGLHIVYGPNEAGKSTTLRALRALLFGVGHVTGDNHVHANNDLRIGALLRLDDAASKNGGETMEVIRRKGRANTLRLADDATPVDAKALSAALGHLDERAFDARFGISHQTLVEGGQEIAAGRGDVGELLFAASAGIAHLSRLQAKLIDDAEALYKQRGQNPTINARLAEHAEAVKTLRRMQLSADDWLGQERELAEAKAELSRIEQELLACESAGRRLSRIAAALPLASRRAALVSELATIGEVPPLSDDFCQRRRDTADQLRLAAHARSKAEQDLARIDARLAELGPLPAIFDHAAAVEAVCGELSTHVKAAKDRVGLAAEHAQLGERIETLIDRIGRASAGDGETRILVRTADRAKIEELGRKFHELSARRDNAERRRGQIERRISESSAELAACPAATDGDALKRRLRRIQPLVALETQHVSETTRIAAEERQLAIDVARLAGWTGDLDALERLSPPAEDAVERFDAQLAAARASVESARRRCEDVAGEKSRFKQLLASRQAQGSVPTEAELLKARQARDAAWLALRSAIAASDGDRMSACAATYEPFVAAVDDLADRLRRDAEAVAARAALESQLARQTETLAQAAEQLRQAEEKQATAERQWRELWQGSNLEPLAPRAMLLWLAERRRLCELAAALRMRQAEQQAVAKRLDAARTEVIAALESIGGRTTISHATLAQAFDLLEAAHDEIEKQRERRRTFELATAEAGRELNEVKDELARAEGELSDWRKAWASAVAPLGHEDDLTPAQAQAVLAELAEMQSLLDKRQGCASRIAGIDRDTEEYLGRLAEVVARACGELDASQASRENLRAVEAIVAELARRLAAARDTATERRKLSADRERQSAELAKVCEAATIAAAAMAEHCREARASSADELPAIEARSRRQAELRRQLAELDERLHEHAAGAALAEFLAELAGVDADGLSGEQTRLAADAAKLGELRPPLQQQIWSLEQKIASTGGRDEAAAANARLQSLRAQLEDDVARYARLRLASVVLRRAIERYREKNEAPLLRRASDIFARLTCGAFSELKTDYDDQKPVLVAVRAESGKSVGVSAMSDGTCDQLYLALRLASVEQYLESHPPIPFIVDDVLQRFDDSRAAAALAAFAELAKKTQVIFFTHHHHVLDLAAEKLAGGDYDTHILGEERSEQPVGQAKRQPALRNRKNQPAPA